MPLTARHSKLIEKALKRTGFVEHTSHHKQYTYYTISGVKSKVKTFISHGKNDYGDFLLSKIAQQLKLTKAELLKFVDSEMSRIEYEVILRSKGYID